MGAMNEMLQRDIDLIRLAQEIAIDHSDIDEVLDRYHLSYDSWNLLLQFPRFAALLANEEEAWRSAKNTKERVKYKAAALIEGYLEEAQVALHDRNQTLIARTGLAKLVAGFAGIGMEEGSRFGSGGGGSGFSITINLGEQTLRVSKNGGENGENGSFAEDFPSLEGSGLDEDVYAINADLG
jgi:hypothetical protein